MWTYTHMHRPTKTTHASLAPIIIIIIIAIPTIRHVLFVKTDTALVLLVYSVFVCDFQ